MSHLLQKRGLSPTQSPTLPPRQPETEMMPIPIDATGNLTIHGSDLKVVKDHADLRMPYVWNAKSIYCVGPRKAWNKEDKLAPCIATDAYLNLLKKVGFRLHKDCANGQVPTLYHGTPGNIRKEIMTALTGADNKRLPGTVFQEDVLATTTPAQTVDEVSWQQHDHMRWDGKDPTQLAPANCAARAVKNECTMLMLLREYLEAQGRHTCNALAIHGACKQCHGAAFNKATLKEVAEQGEFPCKDLHYITMSTNDRGEPAEVAFFDCAKLWELSNREGRERLLRLIAWGPEDEVDPIFQNVMTHQTNMKKLTEAIEACRDAKQGSTNRFHQFAKLDKIQTQKGKKEVPKNARGKKAAELLQDLKSILEAEKDSGAFDARKSKLAIEIQILLKYKAVYGHHFGFADDKDKEYFEAAAKGSVSRAKRDRDP